MNAWQTDTIRAIDRGGLEDVLHAIRVLAEVAGRAATDAQRTHNGDAGQGRPNTYIVPDGAMLMKDGQDVLGRNKGCMVYGKNPEAAVLDCEVCVEDYGDRCTEPTCPCVKDERREP